jgi:hypothetical protein
MLVQDFGINILYWFAGEDWFGTFGQDVRCCDPLKKERVHEFYPLICILTDTG